MLSGCGDNGNLNVGKSNNVNAPINSDTSGNEQLSPTDDATLEDANPSEPDKPVTITEPVTEPTSDTNSDEIFIIIDQTEKPIEGNSFDFSVQKLPEGYMLSSMKWISATTEIVNTLQEAIEHGGNGEDGFYISGNGQFMGFFYDDSMKGEEGTVSFTFTNDQGKTLTWKKEITLN